MTQDAKICPMCSKRHELRAGEPLRFCSVCRFPLLLVAGKYELLEKFDEGGFGVLYLARHKSLHEGARRAVKVFKSEIFSGDDGTMHERFLREVRVTAALSEENQHIVRIYDDFGHEPGFGHYYVMELLRGETLDARIQREGPLPRAAIFDIFYQLCRAMRAAHSRDVIHRDLKPDNIFLVPREESEHFVKVIDFGIAKHLNVTTQNHPTRGTMGTPLYMSPEQCLGSRVDPRTDIYAMGIILFEMFVGTPPFMAENAEQILSVIHSHISVLPPALREVAPDLLIEPDCERAIMRALAKEPTERYPSVEAFWNAIQPYAPKELDLPSLVEPPLDGAFLAALEASATIPAESIFAVPTDPEAAKAWLAEEEGEFPSGTFVVADRKHSHDGSQRAPIPAPFWQRIPTWMWAVGLGLMCCGVLLGVWLPLETPGSKVIVRRVARQVAQSDWSPLDATSTERLVPKRQAKRTVVPRRSMPRRRVVPRRRVRFRRPKPRRLSLQQRRRRAGVVLQRATQSVRSAPSAKTAGSFFRAHVRVLRLAKRRPSDAGAVRRQRQRLLKAVRRYGALLSAKDVKWLKPFAAEAAYRLAMGSLRAFRTMPLKATSRMQLMARLRAKGRRYRSVLMRMRRVAMMKQQPWSLCARVSSAETSLAFARQLEARGITDGCRDCFQMHRIQRAIRFRHVPSLRRTASRLLRDAQEGLPVRWQKHSCYRLARRLQSQQ